MNFHPKAFERGWRGHKECWLAEDVFKEVAAIYAAYADGTYKGNAHAAVEAIIKKAHALGKAGMGGASEGWPPGQGAANWTFYILTVCRTMDWYDPESMPPDELKRRVAGQGWIDLRGAEAKGKGVTRIEVTPKPAP